MDMLDVFVMWVIRQVIAHVGTHRLKPSGLVMMLLTCFSKTEFSRDNVERNAGGFIIGPKH
jgi:hypothetical protein